MVADDSFRPITIAVNVYSGLIWCNVDNPPNREIIVGQQVLLENSSDNGA